MTIEAVDAVIEALQKKNADITPETTLLLATAYKDLLERHDILREANKHLALKLEEAEEALDETDVLNPDIPDEDDEDDDDSFDLDDLADEGGERNE